MILCLQIGIQQTNYVVWEINYSIMVVCRRPYKKKLEICPLGSIIISCHSVIFHQKASIRVLPCLCDIIHLSKQQTKAIRKRGSVLTDFVYLFNCEDKRSLHSLQLLNYTIILFSDFILCVCMLPSVGLCHMPTQLIHNLNTWYTDPCSSISTLAYFQFLNSLLIFIFFFYCYPYNNRI